MSISNPLRLLLLVGSLCAIAALCLLLANLPAKHDGSDRPIAALQQPAAWAVPVDKSFNLYQMAPTLYRSALPSSENLSVLQKLQVQTVVSFIKEDDSVWLGDALVKRVSIPLHADKVDDADVLRVLRAVQDAEAKGPVLMHCKHGRDRTGIMAAMYRSVIQGWSKEDALHEMQQGGYGSLEDVADATRYVESADIAKLRRAFASGECSTTRLSSCYVRNWLATF
ncbi:MAG: tyrosine-protein phosphatase [Pseudomonadaceae bacterium]|nr:tyrosine-protein phosphatase [Pseudomonadaceae bacterium]